MRCNLPNCTGIGEIQFMQSQLALIPREHRERYIAQNGERLRAEYCKSYCPVAKFNARYKLNQESELGMDGFIDRRRLE